MCVRVKLKMNSLAESYFAVNIYQHITLSNTFFLLLQSINILLGCPTPDYYDENCSLSCSPHCINSRCHIETGHCFGCKDGYQGQMCEQRMYFCDHT